MSEVDAAVTWLEEAFERAFEARVGASLPDQITAETAHLNPAVVAPGRGDRGTP